MPAASRLIKTARERIPTFTSYSAALSILAVSALAIAPYLSTIPGYFLGDDFGLVWLYSQKEWPHFIRLFWTPWVEGIYGEIPDEMRPTLAFSYWLDSHFGPGWPLPYRVSNIAVHVLASLSVLGIARCAAGLTWPGAAFAATLFSVLPIHAEAVAWISGRTDSLFALLYLAAFLAYLAWQRKGRLWLYGLALTSFFLALYTKQSAITMVGMLVMYDILIGRGAERSRVNKVAAWLPFAVLTVGHLAQRYFLFGQVVRETYLRGALAQFANHQLLQLQILLFGGRWLPNPPTEVGRALAILGLAVLVIVCVRIARLPRERSISLRARLLFFGPVWWVIHTAPLLVTYSATRHLYLAAVGPAVFAALLIEKAFRRSSTRQRLVASTLAALVVAGGLSRVVPAVTAWNDAARFSRAVLRDIESEAHSLPPGSLLLVAAPVAVTNKAAFTWVLSWSAPFAYRPPFTNADLTAHRRFVDARLVWCCQQTWASSVRNTVEEWAGAPGRPLVALLVWDADDEVLKQASDVTDPTLRTDVVALLDRRQATDADTCAWFRGLARKLVATADPCNEVDPAFHETFYDRPH